MAGLLFETDPAVDGPIGFGAKPGFGFGWGCDSPMHTWQTAPAGFLEPGAAALSFGAWSKDANAGEVSAGIAIAGIDFVNQDQGDFQTGPLFYYAGGGLGATITPTLDALDVTLNGTGAHFPVPFLFGGNALKTAIGAFNPSYPGSPGGGASGGFQSVTGLGFQPDLVIFLGNTMYANNAGALRFMLGMMDAAGNQWVCSDYSIFGSGPTIIGGLIGQSTRFSEFRTDSCILGLYDAYTSPPNGRNRGSFASMDSDGFTIANDESQFQYGDTLWIAYKVDDPTKGFFQVGSMAQGDTSVSGLPLDPEGVILCGDSWSPVIDGAPPSTRSVVSVGGFDSVLNRSFVSGAGSGTAIPAAYTDDSAIVFGDLDALSILARATGALTSGGFDLSWTDDDGGDRPFGWLAFRCPNRGLPLFDHRIPI